MGAVVVMIQQDLQLPVQSVPITIISCEFEPCSWRGALDTTLCDNVCRWFSPGTDRHDTTEYC